MSMYCAKHNQTWYDDPGECPTCRDERIRLLPSSKDEAKLNALGQPSPNRTDFKDWPRDAIERLARQAADENLILAANNRELLAAWRDVMVKGTGIYRVTANTDGTLKVEAVDER